MIQTQQAKEKEMIKKIKALEDEKRHFRREKDEFENKKRQFEEHYNQKKNLFEMQWKMLECELVKLADEKERFRRQKAFYREVKNHEVGHEKLVNFKTTSKMFFVGVKDEKMLRRRYKDLIKIFHPDNSGGDMTTMQAINTEYEKLKNVFKKN